jgi:hypothetical protein
LCRVSNSPGKASRDTAAGGIMTFDLRCNRQSHRTSRHW